MSLPTYGCVMSNILNSSGVLTVIKKFFHINGSVRDIVVNPTYAIVASTGSIDEGETVTYTFTTTDTDGTYYWVNNGNSNAADFSDGQMSGSFVTTNGTGTIVRTLKSDLLTEPVSENIQIYVKSDGYTGADVAASSIVTIGDVSQTAYSLVASTGSINESGTVTYTFTTTGPDGTFYWSNSGTTVYTDFSDAINSGSFAVTAGTGSVSRTVLADNLTEGNETLVFEVRNDSVTGSIISTTIVNVNDTSLTPWSPLQLTNIRGWYKADTGLTLSGLNVNTWADQSGNGNNLVATAFSQSPFTTNPPVYNAGGNPLGGASIDFTTDYMTTYNYTLGAASGSLTVIMIGKVTTWNSNTWLVGYFNSSSTNDNALSIINSTVSNKWVGVGGSSNTPVSSPTSLVTTDAVRIMRRNATSQQAIQNGIVEATTANLKTLPTTNGVLVLGARPAAIGTPNLASTYRIYEVIIMRSYITDEEIASLQTYAANKWGI